ncbi:hypothetical protein APV28_4453 [Comamonas testosteroni]|nr:hypothetical protein APV28_4453 [Comamonas testosteroni]
MPKCLAQIVGNQSCEYIALSSWRIRNDDGDWPSGKACLRSCHARGHSSRASADGSQHLSSRHQA